MVDSLLLYSSRVPPMTASAGSIDYDSPVGIQLNGCFTNRSPEPNPNRLFAACTRRSIRPRVDLCVHQDCLCSPLVGCCKVFIQPVGGL
jgi:hypothetical protein